jgi:protein-disulfide isomerase
VAESKGGDLKAFYWVLGATAVIAAGALLWSAGGNVLSSAATEVVPSIVVGEMDDLGALVEMASGVERGDPNAPVTILEFGDFQCPACQQFATFVKPQLDLAYVDQGTVRFVFHDYPAHQHSVLAHRAARCALDQGEQYYWPYHDQLFAHQSTWGFSTGPPIGAFEDYAATVGVDAGAFGDCLNSDRYADVVSANLRLGIELGVSGTPTIFASRGGGRSIRVTRWNEFDAYQDVIDRMLEEEAGGGN